MGFFEDGNRCAQYLENFPSMNTSSYHHGLCSRRLHSFRISFEEYDKDVKYKLELYYGIGICP